MEGNHVVGNISEHAKPRVLPSPRFSAVWVSRLVAHTDSTSIAPRCTIMREEHRRNDSSGFQYRPGAGGLTGRAQIAVRERCGSRSGNSDPQALAKPSHQHFARRAAKRKMPHVTVARAALGRPRTLGRARGAATCARVRCELAMPRAQTPHGLRQGGSAF